MRLKHTLSVATLMASWLVLGGQVRSEALPSSTIKIGLVNSLFRDTPETLIQVLSQPLKSLMQIQTGYRGNLSLGGDAFELAKQIDEGKVHLGVFHGHEYAWVRSKYPDLVPLVVPIKNEAIARVCLVVTKAKQIKTPDQLKGKTVGLPYRSKGHLYLFLERRCCCDAPTVEEHFRAITEDSDAKGTLDDLLDGYVDAVIIEKGELEAYKRLKPRSRAKLDVLLESEPFPPGAIVYKKGKLDTDVLTRFRHGLITANQSSKGKTLLKLSRLKGFGPIPTNYNKLLTDIAQAYPAPEK